MPASPLTIITDYLGVHREDLVALAGALLDKGHDAKTTATHLAVLVDELIDLRTLPAPWGELAETVDGPILRLALGPVVKAAQKARA